MIQEGIGELKLFYSIDDICHVNDDGKTAGSLRERFHLLARD
ncbi:MAG: hypothetical protein WC048_09750 [Rhizobium sp.]